MQHWGALGRCGICGASGTIWRNWGFSVNISWVSSQHCSLCCINIFRCNWEVTEITFKILKCCRKERWVPSCLPVLAVTCISRNKPSCPLIVGWPLLIGAYLPCTRPNAELFLCCVSLADGVDGKQARRTNSSTPLGELFDHGLDSWACVYFVVSVYSIFGRGASGVSVFVLYYLLWIVLFSFILSHWEKYNTGVLFLPWGYDVSQVVSMYTTSTVATVPWIPGESCLLLFLFFIIPSLLLRMLFGLEWTAALKTFLT